MTIQQGQPISHTDYNNIKAKVDLIYGTGSGDKGYGQTVTSPTKNQGDTISKFEWDAIRHDMVACRQHQTGSTIGTSSAVDGSNLVVVTSQTPITYAITHQYDTFADIITTDRFLIASGQYTPSLLSFDIVAGNAWNGTLTHTITYNATTSDQLRFFFNAGGQIGVIVIINGATSGSTTKDIFWDSFVGASDIIWINSTSTTTSGGGSVSSIGYNDLTSYDRMIYNFYGSDLPAYVGTEFANNSYIINAKKTSTSVVFTILLSDNDTAGTDPNVTLMPVIKGYQKLPTGSNVSVTGLTASSGSSGGAAIPQYFITTSTIVYENEIFPVNISTQFVVPNTVLYWKKIGSANDSRITTLNGQVTLDANSAATFSITMANVFTSYTDEVFQIQLYKDAAYTQPAGPPSSNITIVGSTKFYNMTNTSIANVVNMYSASYVDLVTDVIAGSPHPITSIRVDDDFYRHGTQDGHTYLAANSYIGGSYGTITDNPNNIKFSSSSSITTGTPIVGLQYGGTDITINIPTGYILTGIGTYGYWDTPGTNSWENTWYGLRLFLVQILDSNNNPVNTNNISYNGEQTITASSNDHATAIVPLGHVIRSVSFKFYSAGNAYSQISITTAEITIYNS